MPYPLYGISQESAYPLAGAVEPLVQWVQVHILSGKEIVHAPLKELVLIDESPRFSNLPLVLSYGISQGRNKTVRSRQDTRPVEGLKI